MENLIDLVEQLENEQIKLDEKEQIKILQEIEEKLINEYEIIVGNLVIEPLLVEAYYFDEKYFPDISVHSANSSKAPTYMLARERQKNNFGELYVHYGKNDGIDIVLSKGDYYLSFLIKNALIKGEFKSQYYISKAICEKCDKADKCNKGYNCKYYGKVILKPLGKNHHNYEIVFAPRKNVKGNYKNKDLAALPINIIQEHKFTAGKSKSEIIQDYINKKLKSNDYNEENLKRLAKGFIAWEKIIG